MKTKTLIISFFLLSVGLSLSAANQEISKLKEELRTSKRDTTRLRIYLELGSKTFRHQPDSAIYFGLQAEDLAKKLDDQIQLGYALKNIGLAYYIKGDYVEVLDYWKKSLSIFEEIGDKLGESNLLSNIGAVYFSQGDHPRALDYYLRSLDISEELGNKLRISTALINIGAVYNEDEKTQDQALEFLSRALKISEEVEDHETVGTSSINMGEIYLNKREHLPALFYFEKALEAFEQSEGNIAIALNYIGKTYEQTEQYDKAIEYQEKSYQEALKREAKSEMTKALNSLGYVYELQGKHQLAIDKYLQSATLAEEIDARIEMSEAFQNLANIYSTINDYKKAFVFQTKLNDVIDKIYETDKEWRVNALEFQLDLEKKEGEIDLLNKENDLNEIKIQRASILRNFLLVGSILLLIIILGVYYQYRFAKRSNKIIQEERNRSEEILLNILPKETAEELKANGVVQAKKFDKVTVLFLDIKHFSSIADNASPEDLVKSLDFYFKHFDEITSRHNLEKIKTIGDAYMCAGGLPIPNKSNPLDAMKAAIEMNQLTRNVVRDMPAGIIPFEFRLGLHTGPVLAGVVGTKKFQYDIWGNTVNIASRLESSSIPGRINVSESTFLEVKELYNFEYRGEIEVKQGQKFKMYFLEEPSEVMA